MGGRIMQRNILGIGLVLLFMVSTITPMTLGYNLIKYPSILNEGNNLFMSGSGIPPVANFTYLVEERWVSFDASSSYDPDGTIVSYNWDFGDGIVDFDMFYIINHKYCDIGIYNVTLTVTDNDELTGSVTKSIEIWANEPPPCPPLIDGPTSGKTGVEYNYTFVSVNPDGEDIFLWIDWGDGNETGWIGPYHAGERVTQGHTWSERGTYVIMAKNKDDYCGHESPWASFEVTISKSKAIDFTSLLFKLQTQFSFLKKLLYLIK